MSDTRRISKSSLKVKDRDYAEQYAYALYKVTGEQYEIGKKDGFYYIYVNGSPFRYIYNTSLWKIIAYMYTKKFLQGLFDGDGGVNVAAGKKFSVSISLTNSNIELINYIEKLLHEKYCLRRQTVNRYQRTVMSC